MQEFRPASLVDADTELAAALADRDEGAIRELWARFARPVWAVVVGSSVDGPGGADDSPGDATVSTFVRTVEQIDGFDPVGGFAPMLGDLLQRVVAERGDAPLPTDQLELRWTMARAVESLDIGRRSASDPDARRRIEQRVAHLLDGDQLDAVLEEDWVWTVPSDRLVELVVERLRPGATTLGEAGDTERETEPETETIAGRGPALVDEPRSRSFRPLVLGVGGATAALFGGIVLLSLFSGNPPPVDIDSALVPTGEIENVEGSVEITGDDAGLEIELDVRSLPRQIGGEYYQAWIALDDGRIVSAGTFLEGAELTLQAAAPLERAVEFVVTLGTSGESGAVASLDDGRVVFKLDLPGR